MVRGGAASEVGQGAKKELHLPRSFDGKAHEIGIGKIAHYLQTCMAAVGALFAALRCLIKRRGRVNEGVDADLHQARRMALSDPPL